MKIEEPIPVYDRTGNIASYIVNLTRYDKEAGFIEVSATKDEYPILSYSLDGSKMTVDQVNKLRQKQVSKGKTKLAEKIVSVGPGRFALKEELVDGSTEIITEDHNSIFNSEDDTLSLKRETEPSKKKTANRIWSSISAEIGLEDIGTSNDGVTNDLSFETGTRSAYYNNAMPDINQYKSPTYWTGVSGCSPTSAANIMYYRSYNGYSKLTSGKSQDQVIADLRLKMNTYTSTKDNLTGLTYYSDIAPGMENYARSNGYSLAKAANYTNPSFSTVKANIEFGGSVISFSNQTYYSQGDPTVGHTVTGHSWVSFSYNNSTSGHEYMGVNDNYSTTAGTTYVVYGRNYDTLYSVKFAPYLW